MQRPRINSMTGEQQIQNEWAKVIRNFKPIDLKRNETYLKEKILKNSNFIKGLFQNRDFACLQKILQTHFGTFRERMQYHGNLQRTFFQVYKLSKKKQQQVARLRIQLKKIEYENQRLKSRIIQQMAQRVQVEEQKSDRVVVIPDEQMHRLGYYNSQKVSQLEQVKDSYVGYRESDLPRFKKISDLMSYIDQSEIGSLSEQSSYDHTSKRFSEIFGEQVPRQEANPKYFTGKILGKQQSNKQEDMIQKSESYSQGNKKSSSMPKISGKILESYLPEAKIKTTKKISGMGETHIDLFPKFRNPQQTKKLEDMEQIDSSKLQSKFTEGKNLMLDPYDPESLPAEPCYKKDMNSQRHVIFKHKRFKRPLINK